MKTTKTETFNKYLKRKYNITKLLITSQIPIIGTATIALLYTEYLQEKRGFNK